MFMIQGEEVLNEGRRDEQKTINLKRNTENFE